MKSSPFSYSPPPLQKKRERDRWREGGGEIKRKIRLIKNVDRAQFINPSIKLAYNLTFVSRSTYIEMDKAKRTPKFTYIITEGRT